MSAPYYYSVEPNVVAAPTEIIQSFFVQQTESNQIQKITLPPLVSVYYFMVVGAGGAAGNSEFTGAGGNGCVIGATYNFSPLRPTKYNPITLNLTVGGGGGYGETGGGGGLSQVWDPSATSGISQTINIIAGGGGGSGRNEGGGGAGGDAGTGGAGGNGDGYGGIGGAGYVGPTISTPALGGYSNFETSPNSGNGGNWLGLFNNPTGGAPGTGGTYTLFNLASGGGGGGGADFKGRTGLGGQGSGGEGGGGINGGGDRGDSATGLTGEGGGGGGAGFAGGGGGNGEADINGGGGGGGSSYAFGTCLVDANNLPPPSYSSTFGTGSTTNLFRPVYPPDYRIALDDGLGGYIGWNSIPSYNNFATKTGKPGSGTQGYGRGGPGLPNPLPQPTPAKGPFLAGKDGYVSIGWNTIPIPDGIYENGFTYMQQAVIDWLEANVNQNLLKTGTEFSQPTDIVTSLVYQTYGPVRYWDTSQVKDMSNLFNYSHMSSTYYLYRNLKNILSNFNSADIVNWDTSSVTDMNSMFYGLTNFNQDISAFKTNNVTDMSFMFYGATTFNQDISAWSTDNVTSMSFMFYGATYFDNGTALPTPSATINNWNTSNVNNMVYMFGGPNNPYSPTPTPSPSPTPAYIATYFNQDISGWDVSGAYNMSEMFINSAFDQDVSNWTLYTPTPTPAPMMSPTPSPTPTQSPMLSASGMFKNTGVSRIIQNQYNQNITTTNNNNIYDAWLKYPNKISEILLIDSFGLNKPLTPTPTPTPTPTHTNHRAPSPTPTPTASTTPMELSYSFDDGRVTIRDESGRAINTPVKMSFNIDLNISF